MSQSHRNASVGIGDYAAIFSRRKKYFLIPLILIAAISAAFVAFLPPVYRSEATVLVENQSIPSDIVETTVTGYVQQRIQELQQRILTRNKLLEVAKDIGLVKHVWGNKPVETNEIVELMKDSVLVEMVDVKAGTRQSVVTVAFIISFEAGTAELAKAGASVISNAFVEGNAAIRNEQVKTVTVFLDKEAERLSSQIQEHEKKLAAFKAKHVNQLPELNGANNRQLESTEAQIERAEASIQEQRERLVDLESQLSVTNPYKDVFTGNGNRVLSGAERFNAVMAEYLELSSRYSPNHPDVKKLRSDLESLDRQMGGNGVRRIVAGLAKARGELLTAQQKYSGQHPDVIRLKSRISSLEQELQSISVQSQGRGLDYEKPTAPNNPAYIALKTQISNAKARIRSEQRKLSRLNQKLNELERRLSSAPAVEREYLALTQDYQTAKNKYNEIKEKQLKAELAENLEGSGQSERFVLVDRANLPSSPDRPNRIGIAALGLFLAMIVGLSSVAMAEYMDDAIYGSQGVKAVFDAPPLAIIPKIDSRGNAVGSPASSGGVSGYAVVLAVVLGLGGLAYFYAEEVPWASQEAAQPAKPTAAEKPAEAAAPKAAEQ